MPGEIQRLQEHQHSLQCVPELGHSWWFQSERSKPELEYLSHLRVSCRGWIDVS